MDHVVDDDAGLLPGQFKNDRLTDPAVAAGDDGNTWFFSDMTNLSISDVGSLRSPQVERWLSSLPPAWCTSSATSLSVDMMRHPVGHLILSPSA